MTVRSTKALLGIGLGSLGMVSTYFGMDALSGATDSGVENPIEEISPLVPDELPDSMEIDPYDSLRGTSLSWVGMSPTGKIISPPPPGSSSEEGITGYLMSIDGNRDEFIGEFSLGEKENSEVIGILKDRLGYVTTEGELRELGLGYHTHIALGEFCSSGARSGNGDVAKYCKEYSRNVTFIKNLA